MMPDEELAQLAEDIKANGLREPLTLARGVGDGRNNLLDGRNRLEAIERFGIEVGPLSYMVWWGGGRQAEQEVAYIISKNIKRRHLTKQQQADLIVAALKAAAEAAEKPVQVEPVSDDRVTIYPPQNNGGRGKVNEMKARAVATGAEHGISESTVKRAMAKAAGKKPKKKPPKGVVGDEQWVALLRRAIPFSFSELANLVHAKGTIRKRPTTQISQKKLRASRCRSAAGQVKISPPRFEP